MEAKQEKKRRVLNTKERAVRALRQFGHAPATLARMTEADRAAFAEIVTEHGDLASLDAREKFYALWHELHKAVVGEDKPKSDSTITRQIEELTELVAEGHVRLEDAEHAAQRISSQSETPAAAPANVQEEDKSAPALDETPAPPVENPLPPA